MEYRSALVRTREKGIVGRFRTDLVPDQSLGIKNWVGYLVELFRGQELWTSPSCLMKICASTSE